MHVAGIFLSYRRSDSAAMCDRIYAKLVEHFGSSAVFKDIDSIPLGVDWVQYIDQVLAQATVMIVVIGRSWLSRGPDNVRRLDDPQDMVRLEIEAGLRNGLRVVPVTVDGAAMPQTAELPESLRSIAHRNGWEVHHDPYFETDMHRIMQAIDQWVPPLAKASDLRVRGAPRILVAARWKWGVVAVVSVLVAVVLVLTVLLKLGSTLTAGGLGRMTAGYQTTTGRTKNPTTGTSGSPTASSTPYSPGTVVYQANWSQGLDGWQGSSQWKWINSDALGSDGSATTQGNFLIWTPPLSLPANYSVQAQITLVRIAGSAAGFAFGIMTRGDGMGNGYETGVEIGGQVQRSGCNGPYEKAYLFVVNNDEANMDPYGCPFDQQDEIKNVNYQVDMHPHLYRVDVSGNSITFYIDGYEMFSTTDNTYVDAGQVGLRDINADINVNSFKVIAI